MPTFNPNDSTSFFEVGGPIHRGRRTVKEIGYLIDSPVIERGLERADEIAFRGVKSNHVINDIVGELKLRVRNENGEYVEYDFSDPKSNRLRIL